ncbi:hypothetical protein B0H34DRAFT_705261 [Crassisporium funariophilum]|nr:hypothetical protein B0H34DRAFT_705261 [Crassisporium funariophilum]
MTSRRENEFPATSIGRSSGARLQQAAAAHEAHPLLSPGVIPSTPDTSPSGPLSGNGATLSVNGTPKYVPYTPRQRVTPTSATTGTTVHPPSPQQHQGDATSKLQLMHLKAAAQNIGLDSGTLGWSILEKLVLDGDVNEEWSEVCNAITSGKATLLLPMEAAFTNEKITADFVKDHVVLCDGPSRKNAPIVTLSGLRGTLDDETLTFRSTIHPSSKVFHDILNPSTRTSALLLLPPLPAPLPDAAPPSYPQFTVPSYAPSLVLPPRSQIGAKPPLPPRNNRSASSSTSVAPSRVANTFASLFGGSYSRTTKPSAIPVPSSPPASLRSFDSSHDSNAPVEISAFTIDRRLVRKDLGKAMNKTLKGELKAALSATASLGNIPVPGWVTERVHDMTAQWYPFVKAPSSSPLKKRLGADKDSNINGYLVNPIEEMPEDAAERLQDFYLCLEQDMRVGGTPFISKRREKDAESDVEDEKEREKREHERMESETRVRDVMEAVERTITSLFYDRLFMQPTTDDASHDEALSSRVAALNMLDLGLGHLGIEVGEAVNEYEMDLVVKACGQMLSQLDACRSPGDKAAILVAAHKIVVDGLSRLPPIRLISEDEVATQGLEDDPQTAKPKLAPMEVEHDVASLPSEADDVPASEKSPPAHPASSPTIPHLDANFTTSPEIDALPFDSSDTRTTGSKLKPPPPPLLLSTPISSRSSESPILEVAPPKDPTPVSGDVLLPLIIFSVVKSNPPHLVSNLLFTQRFRNQSVGGEESYCLINLMAVAEFLENVDMAGLGLGDSDKVMSTADLTPIPLTRSPVTSETPLAPADGAHGSLRGRVEQQVDAIADSANKVISGVVDSSFGILRSFMPVNNPNATLANKSAPGTPKSELMKPGFGLLRRESGFSIASLAASLPITGRARPGAGEQQSGQQLVTVSRPASLKSKKSLKIRVGGDDDGQEEEIDDGEETGTTDDEESGGEEENEEGAHEGAPAVDVRSIRSFESMLSAGKDRGKDRKVLRPRKSLSDRLASVSALAGHKVSPPGSRRSSLLQPPQALNLPHSSGSPTSSRASSPVQLRLAPPKQRFIECTPDDLRLSEVGELLRDYRRLVEGIRAVGGFDE